MAAALDWIRLSLVPGLGITGFWRLVDHFRSPSAVLRASRQELLRVRGVRESQISGLLMREETMARGHKELDLLAAVGAAAVAFDDTSYPPLLKKLPDPPPVLYVRGRQELLSRPAVAIVGSRAATAYGRRTACALARNLADSSFTVISGLALGIDAESHAGALSAKGSTVAVLGCGLDVVYPKQNARLFKEIAENGLLVSEYPLGIPPEGFRFPARNRIIAGLSLGVVVVEAARRSGSLITAQIALDCGREVFAVPGQVDSCKSEGTHWLLKQGAKLVQNVRDIFDEIGMEGAADGKGDRLPIEKSSCSLEPEAKTLLDRIDTYPTAREALLEAAGLAPGRFSELLLILELEGLVEILAGDQVRKRV